MKKTLKKLLMALLVFSSVSVLAACGKEKKEKELTNVELSALYKEVALETWEKLGIEDPTVSASNLSAIPDKKVETTGDREIENILTNANTMAGLLYMFSLLYANENYVTTNDIAIFDANVSIMGQSVSQTYTLKSIIDEKKDKVYVETVVTVNGIDQYSNVEIDYDFDNSKLKSFRFMSNVLSSCVDMALTEDNKYMWYEVNELTDDYAVALVAEKNSFLESASGIEKIETSFDEEIQTYMTVLEKTIEEMNK